MRAGGKDALTSSASVEWYTPQDILDLVAKLAPIYLDPCWAPGSLVRAVMMYTAADDGLKHPWYAPAGKSIFVNPPYGKGLSEWTDRCATVQADHVVALLPARTEMAWFQEHCSPETAEEIHDDRAVCFHRGRVRFSGAPAKAPFPSVICYWGVAPERFEHVFSKVGTIWRSR